MGDILAIIKREKGQLSKKQCMIAEFMEDNPEVMAYITLKELSDRLQVSEITVLNTCQSLGFNGYSDIKYEFRKDVIARKKTDVLSAKEEYADKIPSYEKMDGSHFLREVGEEEVSMISQFWGRLDLNRIFHAVHMISQSRKTFICGRGVSYTMATFMVNQLYSCECFGNAVNTELNDEVYGVLSEFAEDTLMVAFSFPDYYFMTTKLAEFAKKKKVKILAITDDEHAEITEFADFVLTVPTATRAFMNTMSAPMFLVNLITSGMKLVNQERDSGRKEDFSLIL